MKLQDLFENGWIMHKKPSKQKVKSSVYGDQELQSFSKEQQDSAHKWWKQILSLFKKGGK